MKLNFKVALPKEKIPLLKEVLSKGCFVKPAPGIKVHNSVNVL